LLKGLKQSDFVKAKFEILVKKPKILGILTEETGAKFRCRLKKSGKKLVIEIDAKDMAGVQAAINSYIEKIKLAEKVYNEI